MPQSTSLPEPLVVGKDVYDEIIYLAVPALKASGINISSLDEDIVTRYKLNDLSVSDDSLGAQAQEIIQVAKVFSKLVLSSDDHARLYIIATCTHC
ncbi:type VI secretion system baseplate subunit TssK [Pseudoalteromonas sp. B193]